MKKKLAEDVLKYKFKNKSLLKRALTHSSFAYERNMNPQFNNERLEFLGDAVLQIVISDYLFHEYKKMNEGDLTRLRASIVCEPTLAIVAREIELGECIVLGKGEARTGGHDRESILADSFEAVLGAIYLDGGLEVARTFVLNLFAPHIGTFSNNVSVQDYKTRIQELIQKTDKSPIKYITVEESGPDHDKTFTVHLSHGNKILGEGTGKSKKDAEQQAAKIALEKLQNKFKRTH